VGKEVEGFLTESLLFLDVVAWDENGEDLDDEDG